MVRGLEVFREHFKDFSENYVIIGGTACDININELGLTPRATKDIDIILVVEALTSEFVKHFWAFIKSGNYENQEKSDGDRKYYRFRKPENEEYPFQIELFSRIPDLIDDLEENSHLTPIPADTDISSLSAILMNDDYYSFTLQHSRTEENIHKADTEALICLKARAYLDYKTRKENGETVEEKQLKKHKADVFRLVLLLNGEERFQLPESIKSDLQEFAEAVKNNLPDSNIFKEMGAGTIDVNALRQLLITAFELE